MRNGWKTMFPRQKRMRKMNGKHDGMNDNTCKRCGDKLEYLRLTNVWYCGTCADEKAWEISCMEQDFDMEDR